MNWDELIHKSDKIVGTIMELNESCGLVTSFLHTPQTLGFRLAWLRHWDYSRGPGCWGKKTDVGGFEFYIPKKEVISLILASNGDIVIFRENGICKDYYQIRIGNPIGAILCAEVLISTEVQK